MMRTRVLLGVALLVGFGSVAQAGPIAINSSNGTTGWTALVDLSYAPASFVALAGATGLTSVVIDRHSAWNQSSPDWISYAQTGPNGTILAPTYNTPISTTLGPAYERQAIVSFTRVLRRHGGQHSRHEAVG